MRSRETQCCSRADPADGKGSVWVVGDLRSAREAMASRRLLRVARGLAKKTGGSLSLVLLGKGLESGLAPWRRCGADRILVADHPRLEVYLQETFTGVLEALVKERRPEILLFLANDCGRELAPRLAARLRTGLCADCIELDVDAETGLLVQTVPAFGDQIYARIVTPDRRPQMATVRPGALGSEGAGPGAASACGKHRKARVERVSFPEGRFRERVRRLAAEKDASAGAEALETARVVICGGRGMGSAARFRSLEDLAVLLGAEVGGTRPAVHAHWIEEDRMVGQTGRSVSPEVLLLFGISGAVQFTAAIERAKFIISVNRDPRSAVFCVSDLGIVGDVRQILPELIRKTRSVLVGRYGKSAEEVAAKADASSGAALGAMLRDHRERTGLSLEEAGQALQMSPSELEQIETGESAPSVSFLLRAAHLFRVDPARFLARAGDARSDRRRAESFVKRTRNYSYRTLTPGAEEKHLRAFWVTIDPRQDHKMIEYRHEGEEFVYVFKGEVEIKVGEALHRLKKGNSLHFDASIPHHLRNPSRNKTELIVCLYTP